MFLADIFAILDRGDHAGIGRRAPDPELFHLLDQRRLGIARRWLGEMLKRKHGLIGGQNRRIAARHRAARALDHIIILIAGLGELFAQRGFGKRGFFTLGDLGQAAIIIVIARHIIAALFIDPQKAVEHHHLTGGAQFDLFVIAGDIDRRAFKPRRRHLTGQRAFPDHIVKLALIGIGGFDLAGIAGHLGGADTLMRLLGVLGLVLVHPRAFG